MYWARILLKLPLLLLHVVLGVLLTVLFLRQGPVTPFKHQIVCWWLSSLCEILRLRIKVHGNNAQAPIYLVSNHISWLDVIVLGGLQPISFLSKIEIRHWPILGYLAKQAGTTFIRRGDGAEGATQMLTRSLTQGKNVLVFPEGTTTDGEQLRNFYPRLFAAAINTKATIQPVSLVYPDTVSGRKTHPAVPLHSQKNFFQSALAVAGQKPIDVIVRYEPTIVAEGDRKSLAKKVQAAIDQSIEKSYLEYRAAQ